MAKTHRLSVADALLKAYSANARINQYLVQQLDPAVWQAPPPGPKTRTIAAQEPEGATTYSYPANAAAKERASGSASAWYPVL